MKDAVLPPVALLVSVLVLIPAPWQWRIRNVAVLIMIFWLWIGNLIVGINSYVWWSDSERRGDPWCDISVRLHPMSVWGIMMCSLTLNMRMASLMSTKFVQVTKEDKRKQNIRAALMCVGVPALLSALAYVYQGHRYDIIESTGCSFAYYQSWPFALLGLVPPMLISTTSLVLSLIAMVRLVKKRREISSQLQSAGSAISKRDFYRILGLTSIESVFVFPVTLTVTVVQAMEMKKGYPYYRPNDSWEHVHRGFGRVDSWPHTLIDPASAVWKIWVMERWTLPVGGLIFIAIFAWPREALTPWTMLKAKLFNKGRKPLTRAGQDSSRVGTAGLNIIKTSTSSFKEVSEKDALQLENLEFGLAIERVAAH